MLAASNSNPSKALIIANFSIDYNKNGLFGANSPDHVAVQFMTKPKTADMQNFKGKPFKVNIYKPANDILGESLVGKDIWNMFSKTDDADNGKIIPYEYREFLFNSEVEKVKSIDPGEYALLAFAPGKQSKFGSYSILTQGWDHYNDSIPVTFKAEAGDIIYLGDISFKANNDEVNEKRTYTLIVRDTLDAYASKLPFLIQTKIKKELMPNGVNIVGQYTDIILGKFKGMIPMTMYKPQVVIPEQNE